MTNETALDTVKKILEPMLTGDIYLVDMKIKPTNNIKIYLDADSGLGIEKCIKINRRLNKVMEDMEVYPDGNFSLEVSSPGVDEPLKMHRQYFKNIGRDVEIITSDEVVTEGKLEEVDEEKVILSYTEGKGKKAVDIKKEILFSDIKQTKVQIKF